MKNDVIFYEIGLAELEGICTGGSAGKDPFWFLTLFFQESKKSEN
jgi:hypothetical protein